VDWLAITIIVISVLLAFLFKFVFIKRVRQWVDRDLLKTLSSGDAAKLQQLTQLDNELKHQGVSRTERHLQLEQLANQLKQ
jgi:hypothetical protein